MKDINWKKRTHTGWASIEIDLPHFMDYLKKTSPEWYVKRGNKNEVKGRIDRFGKFIEDVNKDIIPSEFYFLIDKSNFKPKLIIVNGRHRLAWLFENDYERAYIAIPKEQVFLFKEFNSNRKK